MYPVEPVGKEVIFSGRIEYFSQTDWIKLHIFSLFIEPSMKSTLKRIESEPIFPIMLTI
jgi:hypothetical protein